MSGRSQRQLRQFHRYCSVFFAPAILFFAFSGLLQTVRLNDATLAGPAPAWIKWVAAIHKDQAPPRARKALPKPAAGAPKPPADVKRFVPLKLFVLALSLGLIASTLLGLGIALTQTATRRLSTILLVAGIVVPSLLMAL